MEVDSISKYILPINRRTTKIPQIELPSFESIPIHIFYYSGKVRYNLIFLLGIPL